MNKKWLYIRITLIILSMIIVPVLLKDQAKEFNSFSFSFLIIIYFFCFLGIFILSLPNENKDVNPSWNKSLFSMESSLQNFFDASYYFFFIGISLFIFGILSTPRNWIWELFLPAGLGGLSALKLSSYTKTKK
jgi:hypothetical protein